MTPSMSSKITLHLPPKLSTQATKKTATCSSNRPSSYINRSTPWLMTKSKPLKAVSFWKKRSETFPRTLESDSFLANDWLFRDFFSFYALWFSLIFIILSFVKAFMIFWIFRCFSVFHQGFAYCLLGIFEAKRCVNKENGI